MDVTTLPPNGLTTFKICLSLTNWESLLSHFTPPWENHSMLCYCIAPRKRNSQSWKKKRGKCASGLPRFFTALNFKKLAKKPKLQNSRTLICPSRRRGGTPVSGYLEECLYHGTTFRQHTRTAVDIRVSVPYALCLVKREDCRGWRSWRSPRTLGGSLIPSRKWRRSRTSAEPASQSQQRGGKGKGRTANGVLDQI